jgi:hypothetical protein
MHYDTLLFVQLMVFTPIKYYSGCLRFVPWLSTDLSLVILSLHNVNKDALKVSSRSKQSDDAALIRSLPGIMVCNVQPRLV